MKALAKETLDRRNFLKTTAVATAGASLGLMSSEAFAYPAGSDTIRVGLIGCGGRGSGAARDCVTSSEGVEIWAMGDLFMDRLQRSREILQDELGDSLKVTDERTFDGFDAYQKVLDSGVDMVILATSPGFRPVHVRAAVEAGKHVFMEKPSSTDVAGSLSVIESGELAKEKGLSIVAGTQYRRQPSFMEAVQQVHDGSIGDITAAHAYYLTGPIWLRDRKPGMSDMEWQCRNWYYFTWLSGDHIVEQFVHNLDTINWVMQGPPVQCLGMGGRLVRTDPSYGHIFDHFTIEYQYANGARVTAMCRQMAGCKTQVENRIMGTKGMADINPGSSKVTGYDGSVVFEHPERGNNPYVQEHADLIASIRAGEPLNEAREVAYSTLTGIMGRESAYTGQVVTWDEIMSAEQDFIPTDLAFTNRPIPEVPTPGVTKINRMA